ncbi:uncharacterized protein GGS25DRAFT_3313 [Hypoxylon fragiforme]|uniref:uncharacterized protein n=1 Tax=Hypoxylon fragiforme TaxID=63214 RepID=UPI0020C6E501|nr:uncharacterized protein GGS25DRAFT_3313 [Hypoxylon fragiforme]KAI2613528.1 hypothetical protein GGS25DRAFT_3313 [Hypoxylon fragiforme]
MLTNGVGAKTSISPEKASVSATFWDVESVSWMSWISWMGLRIAHPSGLTAQPNGLPSAIPRHTTSIFPTSLAYRQTRGGPKIFESGRLRTGLAWDGIGWDRIGSVPKKTARLVPSDNQGSAGNHIPTRNTHTHTSSYTSCIHIRSTGVTCLPFHVYLGRYLLQDDVDTYLPACLPTYIHVSKLSSAVKWMRQVSCSQYGFPRPAVTLVDM